MIKAPTGPDQFCDLVMKGGITSGIVYPKAVLALSKRYGFKSIGGTSAGAIAAAASAAAAHGDRLIVSSGKLAHNPALVGFSGLEKVSNQLSTKGFIYSLFQPVGGGRGGYSTIVTLTGNAPWPIKVLIGLVAVFRVAPIETLLALLIFLGIGHCLGGGKAGILGAVIPGVLLAYIVGAVFGIMRICRVMRRNLMGLCSGLSVPSFLEKLFKRGRPGLTEWLHEVLQQLSGKAMGQPLTFRDLWTVVPYPQEPVAKDPAQRKTIALQMITTGVSHHEPRTLPFEDSKFWFRREQFEKLFPKEVMDYLTPPSAEGVEVGGDRYFPLPQSGELPVLVAMRMSLSFPLLISAVPLHEAAGWEPLATDAAAAPDDGTAATTGSAADGVDELASGGRSSRDQIIAFRECWFSDGGISSNFPIHLFDAALPVWPTFAINLVYPKTDDTNRAQAGATGDPIEDAVWLPTENNQGWQRTFQSIEGKTGFGMIGSFLGGILATMQNWRDLLQARAPGYRDRIVHVSLNGDEGGMNLNMSQKVLTRISTKGTVAGERFSRFSFDNHYWIRWRNLASALQRYVEGVSQGASSQPPIAANASAYSTALTGEPQSPSYRFRSEAQRREAEALLKCLIEKGVEWDDLGPNLSDGAPRPRPQMGITPTY